MTLDDAPLAAALAAGLSHEQAGVAVGLSRATVTRRLRNPDLRTRVEELRGDHGRRLADRLGRLSDRACDALERNLTGAAPPAQQVQSARAVLDGALRHREATEIEQRLRDLEAALPSASPNGHHAPVRA